MADEAATSLIGSYVGGCRVDDLLGRGSMGEVYLAHQLRLARPVALKVLPTDLAKNREYRDRFILEARTAARIDHPNVVTIHDAGEEDERLYLVLQLVRGGDLADFAGESTLAPEDVARVGLAVSRALAAAWAEGIVHLDVKPQNVLRIPDGEWKLSDFGIARFVRESGDPDLDAPDWGVAGSPPFMPPEQWEGTDLDGRTDLYALGIMLYRIAAGRYPFELPDEPTMRDWYAAHAEARPYRLRSVAPAVPSALSKLIERLLEKDPARRPASAAVVADALAEILREAGAGTRPRAAPAPGRSAEEDRAAAPATPDEATIALPGSSRPADAISTARTLSLEADPADSAQGDPGASASSPELHAFTPSARLAPLAGREADRRAMADAAVDAKSRVGRVFILTGPRGVGRSRLLLEGCGAAASASCRVLRSRARSLRPLIVVRDILRRLFRVDVEAPVEKLRERLRVGIARAAGEDGIAVARGVLEPFLLDEAGDADTSLDLPTGLPPSFLAQLVKNRARPERPLFVAVDDADRADRSTVEFLAALAGSTESAPIVLAVTTRSGQAADEVLAYLAARAEVDLRTLAPLASEPLLEVARHALGAEPVLPDALARALAEPAGGLPKVVVGAAREARRRGALTLSEPGGGPPTGSVDELRRLAGKIAAQLGAPPQTLGERLATSIRARRIEPASDAAPPPSRGALRRVERLLARGLRLRSFHDYEGAKAEIDAALSQLPDGAAAAVEARVRLELARTLRQAGQGLEVASKLAERAGELAAEAGDAPGRVAAAVERGLALYLLRRYEESLAALDAADGPLRELAVDPDADADAGAAPDLADPEQRRRAVLRAEHAHARGLSLARLGGDERARAATEAFEDAFRDASAAGDQGLYARICQSAGEAIRRLGDLDDAERLLRLSVRYKERTGDLPGLATAYGGLARLARERGQNERAIRRYERDLSISRKIGDHRGAGVAANCLGEILEERFLETGDELAFSAAEEAFEQGRVCARRSRNALDAAINDFYRGRFLCRAGGPGRRDEGLATLTRSLESFVRQDAPSLAAKVEAAIEAARDESDRGP